MSDVADALCDLAAPQILIKKALHDATMQIYCEMTTCLCPEELGGRTYFKPCGRAAYDPWAPSVDHYPVPTRDNGETVVENVRLAHRYCNTVEGARAKPAAVQARGGQATAKRWGGSAEQTTWTALGGHMMHENGQGTEEYRAHQRKAAAAAGRTMRECECGRVMNAGNMHKHCKASQHKMKGING